MIGISRIRAYLPQTFPLDFGRYTAEVGNRFRHLSARLLEIKDRVVVDSSNLTRYLSNRPTLNSAKYRRMINNRFQQLYARLADIRAVTLKTSRIGRSFLWAHKQRVIGAIATSIVVSMGIRYYRNRRQYNDSKSGEKLPTVTLESSLHMAKLSITAPKVKAAPCNVSFAFCIDQSWSMYGARETAVKSGLKKVLDSALRVVEAVKGSKIMIGGVGFNNEVNVLCKARELTSVNIETIKRKLLSYQSSGETSMIPGLERSVASLENTGGKRVLVLLTDGEESLQAQSIQPIHEKIRELGVQLFVVGIGKDHNKETLKTIVSTTGQFSGTYIDTTLGQHTIEQAISKIYTQATSLFTDFKLRSEGLEERIWSVLEGPARASIYDERRAMKENKSEYQLGPLKQGETMVKIIRLHYSQIEKPLDLSTVAFKLSFVDQKGKKREVSLPWNPNSMIDPSVW